MTTLTDAALAAIEARAKAATPGPWECDLRGVDVVNVWAVDSGAFVAETHRWQPYATHPPIELPAAATADFIAHAREDIPALIAALRESREALRVLEASARAVVDLYHDGHSTAKGRSDAIDRLRAVLNEQEGDRGE